MSSSSIGPRDEPFASLEPLTPFPEASKSDRISSGSLALLTSSSSELDSLPAVSSHSTKDLTGSIRGYFREFKNNPGKLKDILFKAGMVAAVALVVTGIALVALNPAVGAVLIASGLLVGVGALLLKNPKALKGLKEDSSSSQPEPQSTPLLPTSSFDEITGNFAHGRQRHSPHPAEQKLTEDEKAFQDALKRNYEQGYPSYPPNQVLTQEQEDYQNELRRLYQEGGGYTKGKN